MTTKPGNRTALIPQASRTLPPNQNGHHASPAMNAHSSARSVLAAFLAGGRFAAESCAAAISRFNRVGACDGGDRASALIREPSQYQRTIFMTGTARSTSGTLPHPGVKDLSPATRQHGPSFPRGWERLGWCSTRTATLQVLPK